MQRQGQRHTRLGRAWIASSMRGGCGRSTGRGALWWTGKRGCRDGRWMDEAECNKAFLSAELRIQDRAGAAGAEFSNDSNVMPHVCLNSVFPNHPGSSTPEKAHLPRTSISGHMSCIPFDAPREGLRRERHIRPLWERCGSKRPITLRGCFGIDGFGTIGTSRRCLVLPLSRGMREGIKVSVYSLSLEQPYEVQHNLEVSH